MSDYCQCSKEKIVPYHDNDNNKCLTCGLPIMTVNQDWIAPIDRWNFKEEPVFPNTRMVVIQSNNLEKFEVEVNRFLEENDHKILHERTTFSVNPINRDILYTAIFYGEIESDNYNRWKIRNGIK